MKLCQSELELDAIVAKFKPNSNDCKLILFKQNALNHGKIEDAKSKPTKTDKVSSTTH